MAILNIILENWMQKKAQENIQKTGFQTLGNILTGPGGQQPQREPQLGGPGGGQMATDWPAGMGPGPQPSQLQQILGLPSEARATGLGLLGKQEIAAAKLAKEKRIADAKRTKISPGTRVIDRKGNVIYEAPGKAATKPRLIKGQPGDMFFNQKGKMVFQVPGGPTEITEEAKFQHSLDKFRATQEERLRNEVLANFGVSQMTGLRKEDREKAARTMVKARHFFDAGDNISTAVLKATQSIESEYDLLRAIPDYRSGIAGMGGNREEVEKSVGAALMGAVPTSKILERLIETGWEKADAIALMKRTYNAKQ